MSEVPLYSWPARWTKPARCPLFLTLFRGIQGSLESKDTPRPRVLQ